MIKPIRCEASIHANISGVISHLCIYMSQLQRQSMNMNNVIWFIQDFENKLCGRRGLNF